MNAELALLVAGMLVFVGGHFLLSWPPVREAIVGRIGEQPFLGLYSVLAIAGLAAAAHAYASVPRIPLWDLGAAGRHLPLAIMPFALMLVILGLFSRNPTAVGGERLDLSHAAAGIFTVTRHPFLCGVALWALAHLAANGDVPSVLLFGGVGVLAVGGMAAIDGKRARRLGTEWAAFARRTSAVPFAAAARGAIRIDWSGIGWVKPLAGVILYAALLFAHGWIFGVQAI